MTLPFWDQAWADGPDYAPNEHDTVFLGELQLPGLCVVDVAVKRREKTQKAGGRDGGRKVFRGLENAKVEIRVFAWTEAHYRILETVTKRLWPGAGKNNRLDKGTTPGGTKAQLAMDIVHPECHRYGVRSVTISGMTSLKDSRITGAKEMVISCEEHQERRGKKVTRKIQGSSAGNFAPEIEAAANAAGILPSQTEIADP